MPDPPQTGSVLCFDIFELDVRAGELRKHGVKLRLHGQPLRVLTVLLNRAGDLVTREELRAQIWPSDTFVDFDHSLHNAIMRIREMLGDSAELPRYIETLPRRGYRFLARVDEVEEPSLPRHSPANRHGIRALAVLPLEDLSKDSRHEYFAEGMTEALITSLAKVKALRVISRTSTMQYKGARKSLPQIARELNVDAVIEGSVLRSGDRIRIAAQLIHATTDQHLWAESYERDFGDILSLQDEIARQVADEVRIVLTPEEKERLGIARPVDRRAHELYLRARYHWNKRTEQSVRKALSYYLAALDTDPTYAQGYAGLADSYNILGYYNALPPMEAYPKAKAAALKALELDHSLAEPHAALGVIKRDFEWDWSGADNEFERAVAMNPGYVESYHWRATLLSMLGRHGEAIQEKKKALLMDPLSVIIRTDLARMFYYHRDYDQALEHYKAAIDMNPNYAFAHLWLGSVYLQKGWFGQAISELQTGVTHSDNNPYALAKLAHGYAWAGQREDARRVFHQLNSLSKQRYVSPYDIATVHLGLQETDNAFEWLERAVEERSLWLGYFNVEPQLDSLRADERFRQILHRVGLDV